MHAVVYCAYSVVDSLTNSRQQQRLQLRLLAVHPINPCLQCLLLS